MAMTKDNKMTNKEVIKWKLPLSAAEVYPQGKRTLGKEIVGNVRQGMLGVARSAVSAAKASPVAAGVRAIKKLKAKFKK